MLKVIGFDADDTLWVNEPNYRNAEDKFCALFSHLMPAEAISHTLFSTETSNLELYGYGAKAFTLSMIETALKITDGKAGADALFQILRLGKELIDKDVELLDGAKNVLEVLQKKYRLILATKGDLLDQERKLKKSGLEPYFHHIEIMSDKKEINYLKLLKHLEIEPSEFLMVGNSLKSDILPVCGIGGKAVYIPFYTTWMHEIVEDLPQNRDFREIAALQFLPDLLDGHDTFH